MNVLLAHQAVTHPDTIVGSAVDVGHHDEALIECYHGFNEAAANTNPGSFLIQTTVASEGDEDWVTKLPLTAVVATPADEAFSDTEPAGEQTIAVVSTTGFAAGNLVYIRDGTLADSEWAIVREIVASTSIILVDGLAREHAATTTTIFGSAEKFSVKLDLRGARRLRAVYLHEGATAADVHIKALAQLLRTRR